jgi:hypothetical protein
MSILYGAQLWQENKNESDIRYDTIGTNSEAITAGDILTITSGQIVVAGASTGCIGVAVKTATMTSTNATVAKVYPGYIPAEGSIFLMGTNSDLTGNATNDATYYEITGTTGVQQVDVTTGSQTSGTTRIVEIVKVDPRGIGSSGSGSGLREVLVRFVKTPAQNVSITA